MPSASTKPLDLTVAHQLSEERIENLECPPGRTQAFLRDAGCRGLSVRVTSKGAKSFVFESKVKGKTARITIGDAGAGSAWSILQARRQANELRRLVDLGTDPRDYAREQAAEQAARAAEDAAKRADEQRLAAAQAVTVAQAWSAYIAVGKPKGKAAWKPRYLADLHQAADPGGKPKARGKGKTRPGHLAPLMPRPLASIDADAVREWYETEARRAPVQAQRAVAMLSGLLSWCATRKEYRSLVHRDAAARRELAGLLPAKRRRTDALQQDQLAPWFAGTMKLKSDSARAYLQGLVLTGARREELASLRWADVDFRWRKLTISDKVGDRRVIPLTPYFASLLAALPQTNLADGTPNPYVFSSPIGAKSGKPRSASGRIVEPRAPHAAVLADAGIPHVSIHGLRRTFSLTAEAAGAPGGAIAQVMGHRPSAVAEGYRPRSIDALRVYMDQIERFILNKAGIAFDGTLP